MDDDLDLDLSPDDFDDSFNDTGFNEDDEDAFDSFDNDIVDNSDDDDLDHTAIDERGKRRSLIDIIKSWMTPKNRLKFKKFKLSKFLAKQKAKMGSRRFNAKNADLKIKRKMQRDVLKSKLKTLGKLSLAALALKMMIDHHSDEIDKDDAKELELLQKDQKKANNANVTRPAMLMALGSLKKGEAHKVIGDIQQGLSDGQSAAQAVNSALKIPKSAYINSGRNFLMSIANHFGFDPAKMKAAFEQLIHAF